MTTIGIVACSKLKLPHAAPAQDLYTSQLFRAARAYCEASYDRWLILSALHGLIEPGQVIEPYDVTLTTMNAVERDMWAEMVADQPITDWLRAAYFTEGGLVAVHAGALYRAPFESWPHTRVPLAGMGIGQQLGWYAARVRERV